MSMPSASSLREIQKAYIAYFGRPADYTGQVYWASALEQNGGNLNTIIQSFGTSVESSELYGSSSTAERIDKIYLQLFNRPAEEAGKNWWMEKIDSGQLTLQSAALEIMRAAQGDDLALVERKIAAAEAFTEALWARNMSHSYNDWDDIAAAREYLSGVTADMTDASLEAHLSTTLATIENATWSSYYVSHTVFGFEHAESVIYEGGITLADINLHSSPSAGVLLMKLNDSLQPTAGVRLDAADNKWEWLEGIAARGDNGFVLWGEHYTSVTSFLWSVDKNLRPVSAITLGTGDGNSPVIEKVQTLSNGKTLVIGSQNSVADNSDAFAIILNSDWSVHAQRRFDGVEIGSYESFNSSMELSNGNLLLVGDKGELFKVDQNLNVLASNDFNIGNSDYSELDLKPLEDGLFLLQDTLDTERDYYIVNENLEALSSFSTDISLDTLATQSPGHFVAYNSDGQFFKLHINVSDPANPNLVASDFKLLASWDGSGVEIDNYIVNGDTVAAFSDNNLFTFTMSAEASPNLAADYQLLDLEDRSISWSVHSGNSTSTPNWVAAGMQLVTVGTLPTYTEEADLVTLSNQIAI